MGSWPNSPRAEVKTSTAATQMRFSRSTGIGRRPTSRCEPQTSGLAFGHGRSNPTAGLFSRLGPGKASPAPAGLRFCRCPRGPGADERSGHRHRVFRGAAPGRAARGGSGAPGSGRSLACRRGVSSARPGPGLPIRDLPVRTTSPRGRRGPDGP